MKLNRIDEVWSSANALFKWRLRSVVIQKFCYNGNVTWRLVLYIVLSCSLIFLENRLPVELHKTTLSNIKKKLFTEGEVNNVEVITGAGHFANSVSFFFLTEPWIFPMVHLSWESPVKRTTSTYRGKRVIYHGKSVQCVTATVVLGSENISYTCKLHL